MIDSEGHSMHFHVHLTDSIYRISSPMYGVHGRIY